MRLLATLITTTFPLNSPHPPSLPPSHSLLDVQSVVSLGEKLLFDLESTQNLMQLELGAARNRLLQLDVSIELITMVAAVGALIAALFGMNLASGLDGQTWDANEKQLSLVAFWLITAVSVSFTIVVPVGGMLLLRRYFAGRS